MELKNFKPGKYFILFSFFYNLFSAFTLFFCTIAGAILILIIFKNKEYVNERILKLLILTLLVFIKTYAIYKFIKNRGMSLNLRLTVLLSVDVFGLLIQLYAAEITLSLVVVILWIMYAIVFAFIYKYKLENLQLDESILDKIIIEEDIIEINDNDDEE